MDGQACEHNVGVIGDDCFEIMVCGDETRLGTKHVFGHARYVIRDGD